MKTKDEGFRRLSDEASSLRSRVRFLNWTRGDSALHRAVAMLEEVAEILFLAAASASAEAEADARPLFDRIGAQAERTRAVREDLAVAPPAAEKEPRKSPEKTFRAVYRGDDADEPIAMGEIKGYSFSDAAARLPEIFAGREVRLSDGRLVPLDPARIEIVRVPARPRKEAADAR